jgi:thiamine pyrophosphokinase
MAAAMKVLLVGAAPLGSSKIAQASQAVIHELAAKADLIVAVDGGWKTLKNMNSAIDLWVGDGDSVSMSEVVKSNIARVELPTRKDRSDLYHALKIIEMLKPAKRKSALSSKKKKTKKKKKSAPEQAIDLVAVGVLGGRRDQEWGAVGEISDWVAQTPGGIARAWDPDTQEWLIWMGAPRTESISPDARFSLFSSSGAKVSVSGAEFTGKKIAITHGSGGMSNLSGKNCRIEVLQGVVVLVPFNLD